VVISQFVGGPCEADDIYCCLLPGPDYPQAAAAAAAADSADSAVSADSADSASNHRGWCIFIDAAAAISIACSR
jgi:hypothetical protein